MQQTTTRRTCSSAEQILDLLTTRQHLRPHQSIGEVAGIVINTLGACPIAVDRALSWLELSRSAPVGRLRRTELMQLARSIHRFWRAALGSAD